MGFAAVAACSSRWDDEDDDDDGERQRPERTPAPVEIRRDGAAADAEPADAGTTDAGTTDSGADRGDALETPDACPTTTRCVDGQLHYTLPPEHGCVVAVITCEFGCDESAARCADADADADTGADAVAPPEAGDAGSDGGRPRLGLPPPRSD